MNLDHLRNPYLRSAKTYLVQILSEKYTPHDEITERVMQNLTRYQDAEAFYKLIADIYEAGYTTCISQYKEELQKLGLKVKVVQKKDV